MQYASSLPQTLVDNYQKVSSDTQKIQTILAQNVTKKSKGAKIGFNSKALSKYVLQNVMQFLYWRSDSSKVRLICKKMKEAWDMHLVNYSKIIQKELYEKYTQPEIQEGENKLKEVFRQMTKHESRPNEDILSVEQFCIGQFSVLHKNVRVYDADRKHPEMLQIM